MNVRFSMFFNSEGRLRNCWELGKRYKNKCFVAWGCFVGAFGRRAVVRQGTSPGNISVKSPTVFNGFFFAQWEALGTIKLHHFPTRVLVLAKSNTTTN